MGAGAWGRFPLKLYNTRKQIPWATRQLQRGGRNCARPNFLFGEKSRKLVTINL